MDVHSSVLPSHSFVGSNAAINDNHNRVPWELVVLVIVWYLCAVVTITTTKEVVNRVKLPFLLCTSQFVFASVLSYVYLRWTKRLRSVPANAKSVVLQISLAYTLGFIFTNIAFSLGKDFMEHKCIEISVLYCIYQNSTKCTSRYGCQRGDHKSSGADHHCANWSAHPPGILYPLHVPFTDTYMWRSGPGLLQ